MFFHFLRFTVTKGTTSSNVARPCSTSSNVMNLRDCVEFVYQAHFWLIHNRLVLQFNLMFGILINICEN